MTCDVYRVTRTTPAKLDDPIPDAITSIVNPITYMDRLSHVTKLLIDATDDEFFMNDVRLWRREMYVEVAALTPLPFCETQHAKCFCIAYNTRGIALICFAPFGLTL